MVETKKKNTDYSASAVNLKNAIEVKVILDSISKMKEDLIIVQDKIQDCIPDHLLAEETTLKNSIAAETESIKGWIDQFGSYQDLERGWYGIKQRKVTKSYNAAAFGENFPEYAPAVIIKAVDTIKLNGLIKGTLLSEEGLKKCGVISEAESFAYIIKV